MSDGSAAAESLVFLMGTFEARFPTDRRYARNHMWAQEVKAGVWRLGLAGYAVRLLQDVYFLDWQVSPGTTCRERQAIGFIESKKAESELYCPAAGRLTQFNERLLSDPSTINVDMYGGGWLFELETPGENFLTPAEYLTYLHEVWPLAQRKIKGQMNE